MIIFDSHLFIYSCVTRGGRSKNYYRFCSVRSPYPLHPKGESLNMVGKLKYLSIPFIFSLILVLGISQSRASTETEQPAYQPSQHLPAADSAAPAGAGLSAIILYTTDNSTAEAYAALLNENGFSATTAQVEEKPPEDHTIYLPFIVRPVILLVEFRFGL